MSGLQNIVRWLKSRSSGKSKSGRRRTLGPGVLEESIASWSGEEREQDRNFRRNTPGRRSLPPIPRGHDSPTRSRKRKSPDRPKFRIKSSGSCSVYDEIPAWAVSDTPGQRTCIALPSGRDPCVRNPVSLRCRRKISFEMNDSADECYEYDFETSSRASRQDSEEDDTASRGSRRSRGSVSRSLSISSSHASSDAGVSLDSGFQESVLIPDDYVMTKPPSIPSRRRRTMHSLPASPPHKLTANEKYLLSTVSSDLTDKLTSAQCAVDSRLTQCVTIPQRVDSSPSRRPTLGVSAMCIKKQQRRSSDVTPPSLQQFQRSSRSEATCTPTKRKLSLPPRTPTSKQPNVMTTRSVGPPTRRPNSLLQDLMRVNHDRQNMIM